MVRIDQALLKWAKTQPEAGDDYVTLVLDEANLAENGLLETLKGLWDTPPRIFVNGQPFSVTARHRVILTGNPDSYAGRRMDAALQEKMQCIYYPVLNAAFLQDRVVEPALYQHLLAHLPEPKAQLLAQQAAKGVLPLWKCYQGLLPEHEFTPRDLTDICAWIGWYLNQPDVSRYDLSEEHIHALIIQGFMDVFGHETAEQAQGALWVVENWFSSHFPVNDAVLASVQSTILKQLSGWFRFETCTKKPDFDVSSAAVSDLSEALLQDLSRTQQAYQYKRKHGGRQATLIEGPTGRGKDVTLQLAIRSFRAQMNHKQKAMPDVHYLNACDCSWDTLRDHIQRARVKGEVLVISEINLIDSQYLEGELNDILAGDACPGFHLFATTNPPRSQYRGRKLFSPALKGRFRHLPIRQYSQEELFGIAAKVLPDSSAGRTLAEQLTNYHCRLRQYLQYKNIPLQPTSLDLQNLARAVSGQSDTSQAAMQELFKVHYRLFLLAARQTIEQLPELCPHAAVKAPVDKPLCQWLHQTVKTLDHPWLIRRGEANTVDAGRHAMTVQADLSEQAIRDQVIKQIAEVQWLASAMPFQAMTSDDTLTQAFYILWQRHWFEHNFAMTGVHAEELFPLTATQSLTLSLAANQPYLLEIQKFLATADHTKPVQQAGNWLQIKAILHTPVSHYSSTEKEEPSKTESAQDAQASLPSTVKRAVDSDTDYEKRVPSDYAVVRTFDSVHDPRMYRLRVFDLAATLEGELVETRTGRGEYGLEVVQPGLILGQKTVTLSDRQTYGKVQLKYQSKTWLYLPSLKAHETIRAVNLVSGKDFTLLRDRYTGLHMIHLSNVQPGEIVDIDYIVETIEAPPEDDTFYRYQETWHALEAVRPDATCAPEIRQAITELLSPQCLQTLPEGQQMTLDAIKQADSQMVRIEKIFAYCRQFSGESRPEDDNLLDFLLKNRQGACRHRTSVFVAFCRYYGIPARIVKSEVHTFPEYSLDNGATWVPVDLGGAPGNLSELSWQFPAKRPGISLASGNPKFEQTMRAMDDKQSQAMAQVLGVSPDELARSVASGMALPTDKQDLTICDIVSNLWDQGSESGFALGCQLLKDQDALSYSEESMLGSWSLCTSKLATVLHELLQHTESISVISKELRGLHDKAVVKGTMQSSDWQYIIRKILKDSCQHFGVKSAQVQAVAHMALELDWLLPSSCSLHGKELYDLLNKLNTVDALKPQVKKLLEEWHVYWLKNEDNINVSFGNDNNKILSGLVTHSHGGYSPSLESDLKMRSLLSTWTDEPEGIPDIERLLTSSPAFPASGSGRIKHRPVLMSDSPQWKATDIQKTVNKLFAQCVRNNPELDKLQSECLLWDQLEQQEENGSLEEYEKRIEISNYVVLRQEMNISCARWRLERLKEVCSKAIRYAFAHYLFQIANSKGGHLTALWCDAVTCSYQCYVFGSREPQSAVSI